MKITHSALKMNVTSTISMHGGYRPQVRIMQGHMQDTFTRTVSNCNDKINNLINCLYDKYALKSNLLNISAQLESIKNSLDGDIEKELSEISMPINTDKSELSNYIKTRVLGKMAQSCTLYNLGCANNKKVVILDEIKDLTGKLHTFEPDSKEYNAIKEELSIKENSLKETEDFMKAHEAVANQFKDQKIHRPLNINGHPVWLYCDNKELKRIDDIVVNKKGSECCSDIINEVYPFMEPEYLMDYMDECANKYIQEINKLPESLFTISKREDLAKLVLNAIYKNVYKLINEFKNTFAKTNEVSEDIVRLASKREEYEKGTKEWNNYDKRICLLREKKAKILEKNKKTLVKKENLLPLYFQWIEPSPYDMIPVEFFRIYSKQVENTINKLVGDSKEVKKLRLALKDELRKTEQEWKKARRENEQKLKKNGITDLSQYHDKYLCEKLH